MRLDKALCHAGWGSRSDMQQAIRRGRITVDSLVVRQADARVEPLHQSILLDGGSIDYRDHYWLMLHKPAALLSATKDTRQATVLSLLDERCQRMGLFPVGRLDKDSTGLLLLTNDGASAHKLLSPKSHVEKEYLVTVEGSLDAEASKRFEQGMVLTDGTQLLPASLEVLHDPSRARITLCEGKYHQIKRMLGVLGFPVLTLHRERMGTLRLDTALPPGGWRMLSEQELERLTQGI